MNVNGNFGNQPNYEPNSLGGPVADKKYAAKPFTVKGLAQR
jgi:catalase